jgi:hypothetical protein
MPHYAFEDLGGGFNFVTQFGSNLVVALAKMAIYFQQCFASNLCSWKAGCPAGNMIGASVDSEIL